MVGLSGTCRWRLAW